MDSLDKTTHAYARSQQRCIPDAVLDYLDKFGATIHAGDGTEKRYFDKKARRRVRQHLGSHLFQAFSHYLNAYMVIGREGKVVTEGYLSRRIRRN